MYVSEHSLDRAKERFGLNKAAITRLANRALTKGLTYEEAQGQLHKYLKKLYFAHERQGNNIRVYGEYVFIFCGERLATVYTLPHNLKKVAKKLQNREVQNEKETRM